MGGQIDLLFDQAVSALANVNAGKMRAYAVTAKTRLGSAPDIPTVDEAGLPGFYMSVWNALWVPKHLVLRYRLRATPSSLVTSVTSSWFSP